MHFAFFLPFHENHASSNRIAGNTAQGLFWASVQCMCASLKFHDRTDARVYRNMRHTVGLLCTNVVKTALFYSFYAFLSIVTIYLRLRPRIKESKSAKTKVFSTKDEDIITENLLYK